MFNFFGVEKARCGIILYKVFDNNSCEEK